MPSSNPVALIILDGWGIRERAANNAIIQANTPNYDTWMRTYERSILDASGRAVGLPDGQMGNSEVGHLNLGAGRIVNQDIVRIDVAIEDGTFFENETLNARLDSTTSSQNNVHLIGLLGSGGVHSHSRHLYGLLRLAKMRGIRPILHLITDGRDTPPQSALQFLGDLEQFMTDNEIDAQIASVSGRYYTMDRDRRWERTQRGYDAITQQLTETATTASAAIQASYDAGVNDEFIKPIRIGDAVPMQNGDALIFFNFRADRMRQIVPCFADATFNEFERTLRYDGLQVFTMTRYQADLAATVLFDKDNIVQPLAQVLSEAGMTQFHSAETEKYPHVTYFFNGGQETPFEGETRHVQPSPKVATYDLQPEMSAAELTQAVLDRLEAHNDDFILVNYANPDMVGHTGSLSAAIKAVETVDSCSAKLVDAILAKGGVALVTADHGNCEMMLDEYSGKAHTYHTTSPVSFIIIANHYIRAVPRGKLADVAPTILNLLGVPQPNIMTGISLIDV
ncbi:MAG: 2,3-bisphosphoglycerate-independent phosphoglycerate mutase [Candidatus Promineifilaceae bacterium]